MSKLKPYRVPMVPTPAQAIVEWMDEFARESVQSNVFLYRGMSVEYSECTLSNSVSDVPRTSTHGVKNNYNLMIDGERQFLGFPRRSQAFIATTDRQTTEAFGNPYLVLYRDGAKRAGCGVSDMWYVESRYVSGNLFQLNELTAHTIGVVKTYEDLIRATQECDTASLRRLIESLDISTHSERLGALCAVMTMMRASECDTLLALWRKFLLGSTLSPLSDGQHMPGEEWIEGECVFIPLEYPPHESGILIEYLEGVNPVLAAYLTRSWKEGKNDD